MIKTCASCRYFSQTYKQDDPARPYQKGACHAPSWCRVEAANEASGIVDRDAVYSCWLPKGYVSSQGGP